MLDQKLFILFLMAFYVNLVVNIDGALSSKIFIPETTRIRNEVGIIPHLIPNTQRPSSSPPAEINIGSGSQPTPSIGVSRLEGESTPVIIPTLTKTKNSNYNAAVVELNPVAKGDTVDGVLKVTKQIVQIIESKELNGVDIVVLPESCLNKQNTAVTLPNTNLYYEDLDADILLITLSMVARKSRKYIVINLYVNEIDENGSTHLYNMVIVFDRNGYVIAKYRKYHLFGEYGVERPSKPDLTTFTTDFGVTFGVAICFDLMFADPMETLINQGVKNFVYPAMWFSGLPYLSSAQYQQSWAYANDVNLLAANANMPSIGCSGSGIYSGKSGALDVFVSTTPATKVLTARVPADVAPIVNIFGKKPTKSRPQPMRPEDVEHIGQENFTNYSLKFLDFSNKPIQSGKVCVNDFCCHYSIEVKDLGQQKGKSSYSYAISVFSDLRRFKSRNSPMTGQDVCSLIACTDMNSKESCGKVIPSAKVHNRYNFKKLQLETTLPKTHMRILPNTLTNELRPFQTNEFDFKVSKMSGGKSYAASMSLYAPKKDLFTFAIFSRDYDRDIV